MKPKKSQWIAAGLLLVLALGLLTAGVWGFVLRGQPATAEAMLRMRNYAVLRTAAGAIVNNIYLQAKLDARAYARAQKFSRNQITVYMDEQGELARKAAEEKYYNTLGIDRTELSLAVESFENSLSEYSRLEAAEKEAYAEVWREQQAALAAQKASEETVGTEDETISEDDMMASTIQKVDYSGFVPSAELAALHEALTLAMTMYTALENALPDLEPEMKDKLREPLIMVVRGGESGFNAEYDSYAAAGAGRFESSEKHACLLPVRPRIS